MSYCPCSWATKLNGDGIARPGAQSATFISDIASASRALPATCGLGLRLADGVERISGVEQSGVGDRVR